MNPVITAPEPVDAANRPADLPKAPRKRRLWIPVRFIVFGVLAVVALLALGWLLSWWSPVPVREVVVTGAAPAKTLEVSSAAGIAPGTPIRDIDAAAVSERVLAVPGIEAIDVVLQRPFTVDLQVQERFPFAMAAAGERWLVLDQSGAVITEETAKPALPLVGASDGNLAPAVAAVGGLPVEVREKVKEAQVDKDGNIVVTLDTGVAITWGAAGDDALKGQTVARLLQYKPEGINVSVPAAPGADRGADTSQAQRVGSRRRARFPESSRSPRLAGTQALRSSGVSTIGQEWVHDSSQCLDRRQCDRSRPDGRRMLQFGKQFVAVQCPGHPHRGAEPGGHSDSDRDADGNPDRGAHEGGLDRDGSQGSRGGQGVGQVR